MKLEAIKTVDQLVMALARHGYRREEDYFSITDPEHPFFCYQEGECPDCGDQYRGIHIYPLALDHSDDYGIAARINHDGGIADWSLMEHNAGSAEPMEPGAVTLDRKSLGERLQAWIESW